LGLGVVAGASYAIWRAWRARVPEPSRDIEWQTAPFPFPPVPRPASRPRPWVEPVDGACPASHQIKAKMSSGIYHEPGGANYERTQPDRCYLNASAAEADGLRRSKV
ncbi:MAG TPA: hypothetical protein VFR41_15145, partial [Acidimicrobiia bacterium]|nr:hypothetical protein [Acidimicrobiia bacterium]